MAEFTKQHLFVDRLKSGKKEYFDDLYNYYYYIALKQYNKYSGKEKEKAKELAEDILKKAITEFVERANPGEMYNISKFITDKYKRFDIKLKNSLQDSLSDLEVKAYQGDYQARIELFNKYNYLIKKFASQCFEEILSFVSIDNSNLENNSCLDDNYPNYLFSKEDINQEFSIKAWKAINHYYNDKLEITYLSQYLSNELNIFKCYIFRKIKQFLENNSNEKNIYRYNNEFENIFSNIEDEECLDIIESKLRGTHKNIFQKLREGKSYMEIANELGISKSMVSQCMINSKNIIKRNGIKR